MAKAIPESRQLPQAAEAISAAKEKFIIQNSENGGHLSFDQEARFAVQAIGNNKDLLKVTQELLSDHGQQDPGEPAKRFEPPAPSPR